MINELNALKDQLQNLFDIQFKICWEKLKIQQPEKIKKVKKNFAWEISSYVYGCCLAESGTKNIPPPSVDSVVNYVFSYHYFLNENKSDSERASLQEDEKYKDEIKEYITSVILKKAHTLDLKHIATIYDPEIYTCDFLIDFMLKEIESTKVSTTNENAKIRFDTLKSLFVRAFYYVKTILLKLTQTSPMDAIITWRTLFETEYIILVLIKYDWVLTSYYRRFGELVDRYANGDPQARNEYESFAKKYGKKPQNQNFKNYGWILKIEDCGNLKPCLKTLLKIAKYDEYDHEKRYLSYGEACKYSHSNATSLNVHYDDYGTYLFVIANLFDSIYNLRNALITFLEQHKIKLEDGKRKEFKILFNDYLKIYNFFISKFEETDNHKS